jgi:hypothetical protein
MTQRRQTEQISETSSMDNGIAGVIESMQRRLTGLTDIHMLTITLNNA